MATAETARLIASLELQDKNFTRGIKAVERGVGRVDRKLGAFSGAVNRNVGRAVDNVTARLLEVPGAVISAAVEQETAITGIRKTIEGDVTAITDELKKLSTETGSTFTELAGIAELGGAMGIAKDDVAAFTKQVAILGATTDVTVEDAATALGQLKTVLGFTGEEFDNFAATLVDLGNKGNSTEAQILDITKRTGAAAKTIGLTTDKTLAWASAAANLGLSQEIAGTAISKLFVGTQKIVARQGDDLKEMGKIAGMTGKQFKKAFDKDASGALFSFIEGLKGLSKEQRVLAIESLFGKGDAMTKTLLGLSEALDDPTSGLTASLKNANTAWEEGTAAQEEADKRFATSEFLFKRLGNSVNLAAATIGTELLPVLNDLATEGLAFLSKPATQKGIKDFATGLGKGVRALAGIVTSINWSAVAGFLSTAAGFAGQLVTWFTKMPDWAQAFLIGGFVATKLPVVGGLISELGKGLIKGVLGMTAGVVHIKAGTVVGGGGAPVPGGKGGKGGKSGGRFGGAGGLLLGLTGVGLAGMLASEFEDEIQGLATDLGNGWRSWLKTDLHIDIPTISPKDIEWPFGPKNTPSILPEVFGGNGLLGGTPGTANEKWYKPPPGKGPPSVRVPPGIKPSDIKPVVTNLQRLNTTSDSQKAELGLIENGIATLSKTPREQQATKNAIENAKSIASRENAATKAKVADVAVKTQAARNAIKAAQSINSRENSATKAEGAATKAAAATAGRTVSGAVNTNAAATRGVAPPISAAVYAIGRQISAAVWAARPVIQSTNVVNNYTQRERTGATSGSRGGTSYSGYR